MRTNPKEDFLHYSGPKARRSIHSTMEHQNNYKYSHSRNSKKQPIGWIYESNKDLNRSESDLEDEEYLNISPGTEKNREEIGSYKIDENVRNQIEALRLERKREDGYEHYERRDEYIKEYAIPRKQRKEGKLPAAQIHSVKESAVILKEENFRLKYYIIILILMLSVFAYYIMGSSNETEPFANKKQLQHAIENIRTEFPSQEENIWPTFSSGIKDVDGNPSHPSVFVMLYDSGEDTPTCLAVKIAKAAMNFLNATKSQPIIWDGAELGKNKTFLNDYGEFIVEEKEKVEEHRTMIVKNLHEVPWKVAESFHSLCDTYTPFVEKAVYLFTLRAEGTSSNQHATKVAEKELEHRWKNELNEDKLMALITRITDTVVFVKSETSLSCKNVIL